MGLTDTSVGASRALLAKRIWPSLSVSWVSVPSRIAGVGCIAVIVLVLFWS